MKRLRVVIVYAMVAAIVFGFFASSSIAVDEPTKEEDACLKAQIEKDFRLRVEWYELCEAQKVLAVLEGQARQIKEVGQELERASHELDVAVQRMRCMVEKFTCNK